VRATGTPTPSPSGASAPEADRAALRRTLATEHAVVYGTAAAGAVLASTGDADNATLATALRDAARARRDTLQDLLATRGETPPGPLAAYRLAVPPVDGPSALALLVRLQEEACAAWRDLLRSVADPGLRGTAGQAMAATATAAAVLRIRAGTPPAAAVPAVPGT
jgi:hypothetical protein